MQKRILLCGLAMFFYFISNSQRDNKSGHPSLQIETHQNTASSSYDPFSVISKRHSIAEEQDEKQLLTLDREVLQELYRDRPDILSLRLPYTDDKEMILELHTYDLLADGFYVRSASHPDQAFPTLPGIHYRGVLKGHPESTVSLSVFANEIIGMLSDGGQNTVIEPLQEDVYQLYTDNDVNNRPSFSCRALAHDDPQPDVSDAPESSNCVKVYLECDYALFQNKGSVSATVHWITAVFNNVSTLYANEGITTALSEIFVWDVPDPYSRTSAYNALTQFRSNRPTYNGDIAHLAALGGRNLGGIAWLDVLCSSYGYAYSNISSSYHAVPTYSWTVEVMTHEMGHNLGSNHTQWCGWPGGAIDNCYTPEGSCGPGPAPTNGGTIMSYCHLTSYGINFNNGFGPYPGDKIRSEVNGAGCLGTCTSGCSPPTGLSATSITTSSAQINWNPVSGATEYKLDHRISGGTWSSVTTTSTIQSLTGLSSGTTYETRVAAKCNGSYGFFSTPISFTTATGTCATPAGPTVSNITATSAFVDWSDVSGAVAYQLEYREAGGTWLSQQVTTSQYDLTGLMPGTLYDVRVRTLCTGGSSPTTTVVNFTTLSATSYCTSRGNNSSNEWISRVAVGGFDRSSGSDGGYYDGTHLIGEMTTSAYNIIYFQADKSGGRRNLYWRIWIDFNQDGDFDDAGELTVSGYSNYTGLLYSYIYVPGNAPSGATRMRVSMRKGGYPGSCQVFSRGEVEDYTINILPAGTLVQEQKDVSTTWGLTPNPTSSTSIFNCTLEEDMDMDFDIIDMYGRSVRRWKQQGKVGSNFFEIPSNILEDGHYYLNITYGNKNKVLRLLKM